MRARIRNTELYFDIDGMGLVPHTDRMVQRPVLFLLHGGPGGDHTLYKRKISALRDVAQLVYIDNRGSGRSVPCDPEFLQQGVTFLDHSDLERISNRSLRVRLSGIGWCRVSVRCK